MTHHPRKMSCLPPRAPKAVSITPEAAQSSVNFQGWGTSLAWFAHALGHDPQSRDTVLQLLFSKDKGLGLNIVR